MYIIFIDISMLGKLVLWLIKYFQRLIANSFLKVTLDTSLNTFTDVQPETGAEQEKKNGGLELYR